MKKEKRSNKWTFLIYEESAPPNYREILDKLHIPYVLSPWHDKDVNRETGEFKKKHKHGALFFDSLKSYSQVSELLTEKLNTPAHVEIIMSPKGMYDYFTHAENPEKASYKIEDIESGCGFDLEKFLSENNADIPRQVFDILRDSGLKEFSLFTDFIADNYPDLFSFVFQKSYFFKTYLDSKRHIAQEKVKELRTPIKEERNNE